MKQPLLSLALVAALAAGPALAQDATPAPESDAPAPAANTNIGGALDLGEDANAAPAGAPQAPRTYVKEKFGDWNLQCLEVADADDVCQMYQLLKDATGNPVAEASIFKLANGGQAVAGGTFVVPLETLLSQKLTITVDGGAARRYDYSFCAPVGCYARVGFVAEDIARFKAGAKAKVTIVPALAPDQKVEVEMSLTGFTAAYDQASSLNQ
ncbi:invasion associated locus B family protein [Tropicibacter naphthalenivorans]|uniref:Invasion protein B, involved in pathogenesis n=1 Tax=Tropicibacter naphthalenivorans TaxID=441103 RepID=A0A0P1G6T8_9RHOB|nr:invasion associated locus B family protein [Tropicibacter naphthalenivorans]CUH77316.1 Invasion protein B, involved in pathogenesis [Tropicibacter naphthalenivorans]SMC59055.1 Invasion protein IalB, involved in pathogenesis [Tropicibacter naphthalenivorans]